MIRERTSGLAIILTALACLFVFWRLSPGLTFAVAAGALPLLVLVVLFWMTGGKQSDPC